LTFFPGARQLVRDRRGIALDEGDSPGGNLELPG
jgi:hypothetical protein